MPESLQQKVDRMTAGMEVTVTLQGTVSAGDFSVRGNTWAEGGTALWVGDGDTVRHSDGTVNPRITAIDMPDPECPFEMGARVVSFLTGNQYIVDGWEWSEVLHCWAVKVPSGNRIEPGYLTLVPPEPAEPDCPAILVTYTNGNTEIAGRNSDGTYGNPEQRVWFAGEYVATVQALRPAEYLRGGR